MQSLTTHLSLDVVNKFAAQLTKEQIRALTDEQITSMSMPRPGHPGQHGFMLQLPYFKSQEHLAWVMFELMDRFRKVKKNNDQ